MLDLLKDIGLAVAESVVDTWRSNCKEYSRDERFSEEQRDAYKELEGYLERGQEWLSNARLEEETETNGNISEEETVLRQKELLEEEKAKRKKMFEKMLNLYVLAVEEDNAEAQYQVALAYLNYSGKEMGLQKDDIRGMKWLMKAANHGHVDAQYEVASCFWIGRGVSKDDKEAMKWCRKAAENGNANAMFF